MTLCYVCEVKLKRNPLWKLMFSKLLKLNLYTFTVFIIKPKMPALSSAVIFIKFPVMHWHFNPVLNASVMVARAAMRVYMFHSRKFHAPVMSSFFFPLEPFDDVTLDAYVHFSTHRCTLPMVSLISTLT